LAVSAVCLYFALRGTDWGRVGQAFEHAHLHWVLASVLAALFSFLVRTERWRVLLRPVADVPFMPAFSATAIGFGASMVLPLRLGEIIRPTLLARRVRLGVSAAISSIVLERLFDMLLVISCFLLASLIYQLPEDLRRGAIMLAVLAGGGFVFLVVVQRRRQTADRILERILARLPERPAGVVRGIVHGLLDGLSGLSDVATVVRVLVMSAALWGVICLTFVCGLLALDIDVPLISAGLVTMVIVAAFVFLPQAPGFVGTWQVGCVVALELFGVPKDLAVSYSLLTWLIQMLTNIGLAGIFVARQDLSVREMLETEERAPDAIRQEG
jgi:uncharacterized protein (TIRG00374 family)